MMTTEGKLPSLSCGDSAIKEKLHGNEKVGVSDPGTFLCSH